MSNKWTLALLLLLGCQGSEEVDSSPKPMEARQANYELSYAYCAYYQRCRPDFIDQAYGSLSGCIDVEEARHQTPSQCTTLLIERCKDAAALYACGRDHEFGQSSPYCVLCR